MRNTPAKDPKNKLVSIIIVSHFLNIKYTQYPTTYHSQGNFNWNYILTTSL